MAIYKLNSEKAKNRTSKARKITGFTLIGASSLIFLFMTGIVPVLQKFLLGVFGVFGYLLCILLIIIGLAVLNRRKYVMPKRYAVCLILAVIMFVCIVQLIIVGNKYDGEGVKIGFWQYLGSNYTKTWTAGGILAGLLTTAVLYITNLVGAYLILGLGLAISIALLIDSLNKMKEEKVENEPVSVQIKEAEEEKQEKQEEINVVLKGNLQKEEEPAGPPTAKQLLGLDHKRNYAYEYHNGAGKVAATEVKATEETVKAAEHDPKDWKKYILTPPQVDIDEYFKNVKRNTEAPQKEEVNQNVSALKQESVENSIEDNQPQQESYDAQDEFVEENTQFARPLEEVETEEIVGNVDDILQSVIEEERDQTPQAENYTTPAFDSTMRERNMLDRMPERDNTGSFERRSFDRGDRVMSQEDRDARDSFNRDYDTINARNGSLSREVSPIPQEEPEIIVPYDYQKPSLDFITTKSVDLSTLAGDVAEKRVALENALEMFGIPAKVQGVLVGPAVTRYELEMPMGISVAKIKGHADDIAYALAAQGAIRIEAPVPGKSVVGIEVPNASIATISLRDILESSEFVNAKSPLTFAIGKDISGKVICANMTKLTHLLVAGTTGSGKSVCLNSIILSIVYKASPEDVKIVLVDPKKVEFTSYEGLPHLLIPEPISDTQKAINMFNYLVDEMEKRYELFRMARVKMVDEYNQTPDVLNHKVRKMPYIVVIVDELADLMMTGKKEVEDKIVRLAQKARAAGIHLILATQKPSADVMTTLIKSNCPSRIAFAVKSSVDSQVILDRVGAEKLLGKGDMLYAPHGAIDPVRVQGCFVGTQEINNIVDNVRDNNEPIFDADVEKKINNPNRPEALETKKERDILFPQAVKACIDAGTASGTMLRRKFAIGFSRAGALIDQMEEAGYISTANGAKPRTVYITEEEYNDIFGSEE